MLQTPAQVPPIPQIDLNDLEECGYLGKGGYGVVFLMKHTTLGEVALKKLIEKHTVNDAVMLLQEAEYYRKITHQNILILHGIAKERNPRNGSFDISLVLEYAPYGSLYSFIRNRYVPVPDSVKLYIMHGVAEAMKYLHSHLPSKNRGVHRDLKPENILIAEGCIPKLGDFGLAKWLSGDGVRHSNGLRTVPAGTLSYIPPESWSNPNMKPNEKFDVFAFGMLFWAVMAVKQPYSDDVVGMTEHMIRFKVQELVQGGFRPEVHMIASGFAKSTMRQCWHQRPEIRPEFVEVAHKLRMYKESNESDISAGIESVTSQWKLVETATHVENAEGLPSHGVPNLQEIPLGLVAGARTQSSTPRMTIDELCANLDKLAERVNGKIKSITPATDAIHPGTNVYVFVLKDCLSEVSALIQHELGSKYEDVKGLIKIKEIVADRVVLYGEPSDAQTLVAGEKIFPSCSSKGNVDGAYGTISVILQDDMKNHYVATTAHISELDQEMSFMDRHGTVYHLGKPVVRLDMTHKASEHVNEITPSVDMMLIEATKYPVSIWRICTPVEVCNTDAVHNKLPRYVQMNGATSGHTFGRIVAQSKWYSDQLNGDAILADIEAGPGDSGAMIVTWEEKLCTAISYVVGEYTGHLRDLDGNEIFVNWVVTLPFKPALDAMQKELKQPLFLY